MQRKRSVTAKDIAQACNISQATVSYVINNTKGKKISENTRKMVLETAQRLNYVPNYTARSMRTSKSLSIGVVLGKNNINFGVSHVLRGIKNHLDKDGYSITLLADDESSTDQHEYVKYYLSNRIDGILFLFYEMSEETAETLKKERIPFFVINEGGVWYNGEQKHRPFEDGISQCVEYCKERKFQRIRYVSLNTDDTVCNSKWELLQQCVLERYSNAELCQVKFDAPITECENIINLFLQYFGEEDFDMVITPNQRIGWLMQSAILRKEFCLPQSIRHICLSPSHAFNAVYPTVTCLDMPLVQMGDFAAEQMENVLLGKPLKTHSFHCKLKLGMSTE